MPLSVKQLIEKLETLDKTKCVSVIFDGCAEFNVETVADSEYDYVYLIGDSWHAPYAPEDYSLINYKKLEDN